MVYLDDALPVGASIGHYTVSRSLGRGGMGEVYLAYDRRLGREVALKVLSREVLSDPERVQVLNAEARALAALNHPNIVTIFDVADTAGMNVLVMEFIDGQTLRAFIRPGGVPLDRFCAAAVPLADALAAAHEQGVAHRDLKPENIMLTRSGRLKVLDFGLAKMGAWRDPLRDASGLSAEETLPPGGALLGTIPYMAPEQIAGDPVDSRADIFSLGVVLFEMLTGHRPFTGETAAHVISSIVHDTPPALSTLRADVPLALEAVVRRCLSKDPQLRYQSARDVHMALQDLADHLRTPAGSMRPLLADATPRVWRWIADIVRSGRSLRTRTGCVVLIAAAALANWIETTAETSIIAATGAATALRRELARSMHSLEGRLTFDRHDLTSAVSVYGYSAAYFFVMPLLVLLTLVGFARRTDSRAFRTLSFALVFDYVMTLPFYLFFPVPERWAYPESEAILLSDMWSSSLIEFLRPISALDNCFPSFHVSATVVTMLAAFRFGARYRMLTLPVGCAVIASTFVLGMHWLPDILAGIAAGIVSMALAVRADARLADASRAASYCGPTLPAS